MASFENRNGNVRVLIRKKGHEISRTFSNRETAELWARYKEDLIDEMEAFEVKTEELVLLKDAIEMKRSRLEREDKETKPLEYLHQVFPEFLDCPINLITFEDLKEKAKAIAKVPVVRGGNGKEGSGKKILPSKETIRKRFVLLGTVYSLMIEKGLDLTNEAQKTVTWIMGNM